MEKENKQSNAAHLYGTITGYVSINDTEKENLKAVHFLVSTYRMKANGEKDYADVRVTRFTSDENEIKYFEKVQDSLKANKENREVEGYKPEWHHVSVDGRVFRESYEKEGKTEYSLGVVADSMKLDAKHEEKEVRNSVMLSGEVGSVETRKKEDGKEYKLVNLKLLNEKDGEEKTYSLNMFVYPNEKSQSFYDSLAEGSKVEVYCRMKNEALMFSSSKNKALKQDETKTEEVKAEPEKKAAKEKKAPAAKKPVSKKKSVTLK